MSAPPDHAHQINFGLQNDEGVTVVGGTLADDAMLVWLRRLQVHLRLQRFRSEPPPAQALSTFEFPDGWTAIVRRWNSGGTLGRNDAMALIAPTVRLPLPVVLGLDRGLDWAAAAAERPFRAWNATQLQDLGDEKAAELRHPAKRQSQMLRRALERLFDAPGSPLTIVGCPDEQRIPLLWGLHKLGAGRLLQQNQRRTWTFSTYEVEDADSISNLPSIVFLPDTPVGSAPSHRVLVDVRTDQNVSGSSARAAGRRVELFLDDREDRADFEDQQAALAEARTQQFPVSAGARRGAGDDLGHSGGSTVAMTPSAGPGGADGDRIHHPAPAGSGRPDLAAIVARVSQADGWARLRESIQELRQNAATPDDRGALRGVLTPAAYVRLAGDLVGRPFLAETQRSGLFRELQTVVLGPQREDLSDRAGAAFALDVLEERPPPALGGEVAADLKLVYRPESLGLMVWERWLKDLGVNDRATAAPAGDGVVAWPPSDAPTGQAQHDAPARWWSLRWLFGAGTPAGGAGPQNLGGAGQAGQPVGGAEPVAVGAVPGGQDRPEDGRAEPERIAADGRRQEGSRPWETGAWAASASSAPAGRWWLVYGGAVALVVVVVAVFILLGRPSGSSSPSDIPPLPQSTSTPRPAESTSSAASAGATSTSSLPAGNPTGVDGDVPAGWAVSGTVVGRTLKVLVPVPSGGDPTSVRYLYVQSRQTGVYYYRGQCANAVGGAWPCAEPTDIPAVPGSRDGYKVVVVTKLGAITPGGDGKPATVSAPGDDDIAGSVKVAS